MKATGMKRTMSKLLGAAGLVVAAVGANLAVSDSAAAYVGPSFIQIPGIAGNWKGASYKGWIKADGNYWDVPGAPARRGGGGLNRGAFHSGPAGPKSGAGKLVVGILKDSPVLARMMKACADKKPIAEMGYAENAALGRAFSEIGPRPAAMPEFFEYKLKDVTIEACPVVDGAPQQAFVLGFKESERVNYTGESLPVEFPAPEPAKLIPASAIDSGKSKSFVVSWFAQANNVSDDQCPVMAEKPSEEDYYRLMSKEDAEKERIANAQSGVNDFKMGRRGPMGLDVSRLPGIVVDPGMPAPKTRIARGFNLDGDDGTGKPPSHTRKHVNYVSPDGRTGIDNQLYTTQGCISAFQGKNGFHMQFSNGQMRDGAFSMLIEIIGIDDERNDDNVEVAFSYSLDHMAKNAAGNDILADYTFRLTDKPQYTYYFSRLKARIKDGVILTDPVDNFALNLGTFGWPGNLNLAKSRVRLEIQPDGRLVGYVGGYLDWRMIISPQSGSAAENVGRFQLPALYNALRNAADGLKDPVSGEFNGLSATFDIEGVPTFVQRPIQRVAQADASEAPARPSQP